MQETNSSSQEQHINPEHFPHNRPERAQNFSFASSYPYAPGRQILHSNPTFNVQRYQSPYDFQHVVTNAFSVLHNSVSEPDSTQASRPNQAIVRPIIREQSEHVPERAAAGINSSQPPLTTRSCFSRSTQEVRSFADELSQKLRFLAPEENNNARGASGHSSSGYVGTGAWLSMDRPRFETTVPTGIFLPPPNELQLLPASMLRRHVYAYSSYPMILQSFYNQSNPSKDKENRTSMRQNGVRATAAVAAAAAAVAAKSETPALAGSLQITKAQFQQQLQQRRQTDKRPVVPPPEPYMNVMYDRRVIKGSNFGSPSMVADIDPFDKAAELRRRNMLRKRTMQCRNQRNVLGTPPPVKGRKHENIQTEKYLEKLVQRPPEFTVDTQTDLFLEKPPTPPYVPAKVGVDASTEIGEGELFHFDAEAQPIIDVLVDACIEQSILEVAHEMELDALRRKQEKFLAQREAELAELRRLEAEELRLQAEKERRLRQDAIAKELDEEMQKSVTAAKLLQGHIASLVPEVLENIEPASDAVKKEQLMKSVCPWLSAEVAEEVGHIVDSREILTAIIQEIIKQRASVYMGYKEPSSEPSEPEPGPCEEEGCTIDESCPCEPETEMSECPEPPPEPPHL
ncbi:radial spoke head protein 3 homolog A isoform X1 [Drosophila busckii]|uniref:radial spoke head protein 3 homolog A isoform X1 n=1 Tax=Drosophila busckii TaxID=30019 RepID=UPI00083F4B8D|nr:radial spoke head protein 3 homolog A isoform X1 [Drosophila busckii]XP_017844546.1 radial spoke head protein 3 homolog A isoform X1 [Drosophila busckii]